jgi:hypothetical protein
MDDNLLQKAQSGDKDAIFAVLSGRYGVDPAIVQHISGWHRGRERDHTAFATLVAARKHYVKRGWLDISKPDRINELIEKFGLSSNVANHIANGQGYEAVRKEATRQLKADADETESNR